MPYTADTITCFADSESYDIKNFCAGRRDTFIDIYLWHYGYDNILPASGKTSENVSTAAPAAIINYHSSIKLL